jgi:hypothetical protein
MTHHALPGFLSRWSSPLFTTLIVLALAGALVRGETPGEFRPRPTPHPLEKVGATGFKIQPPETLPQSRAPGRTPHRKPKLAWQPQPSLAGNTITFNAGWEMIEAPKANTNGAILSLPGVETGDWYDATVPGTVLTTLVNEGVYPNPYFGLNNLAIPESLNKQDYWYRTEFTVPPSFAGKELELQFNGINYYAEIWLNGQYLGHITGAFIRGRFRVTALARPGVKNVLAVMIAPPPDPGIPSEQSMKFGPGDNGGALCLDGPTFVCSEGWDWIPAVRDRCAGIWQDVLLRATGPVTLADPHVVTALPGADLSRAEVTVHVDLHAAGQPAEGTLKGAFEGVEFARPVSLSAGETRTVDFSPQEFPQLTVHQPRLWWPNGYGKPELYHLRLSFVTSDGAESDTQEVQFGIRQMSYELEVGKADGGHERMEFTPVATKEHLLDHSRAAMHWRENGREFPVDPILRPGAQNSPALRPLDDSEMGRYLVIKVNGQKILCLGGNWGMDDAMKNVSREKLEPYVRLHRDAHLNMIRNWSGQDTSETFYDLCDQYGLLVWNDFWMDTEGWNYVPLDHDLFLRNVADTITRFRNHPSIAIWCAMNEGVPPDDINEGNDRLVRQLDGTRYYQPNSRWVNLRVSGPWSNQELENYFTNLNSGFSTEMGASSIPSADVMRSMMSPADLWPPGDVWAYHDFHSKGAGNRVEILKMISRRYGDATSLEDLCRKAQMVNYETYRAIYEGFNSRMWKDCSGVLVWMSHPSWPSVVWQFYSSDYDPNASFFGVKKAAEPIHIQMNLPDCAVAVINHLADPISQATATATRYSLLGIPEQTNQAAVNVAPDTAVDALTLDWPATGAYFLRLELRDKTGQLLSQNFYWHARQEEDLQELNTLAPTALDVNISQDSEKFTARVSNTNAIPALEVHLTLRDPSTQKRVLPVYYSDNFFALLPGESRDIQIETSSPLPRRIALSVDGWNVTPNTFRP